MRNTKQLVAEAAAQLTSLQFDLIWRPGEYEHIDTTLEHVIDLLEIAKNRVRMEQSSRGTMAFAF